MRESGFLGALSDKAKKMKLAAGLAIGIGLSAGNEALAQGNTDETAERRKLKDKARVLEEEMDGEFMEDRAEQTEAGQAHVDAVKAQFLQKLRQMVPNERIQKAVVEGLERDLSGSHVDTTAKKIEVIRIYAEELARRTKNNAARKVQGKAGEMFEEMSAIERGVNKFLDGAVAFEEAMLALGEVIRVNENIKYNGINLSRKGEGFYWNGQKIDSSVRDNLIKAYRKAVKTVSDETGGAVNFR